MGPGTGYFRYLFSMIDNETEDLTRMDCVVLIVLEGMTWVEPDRVAASASLGLIKIVPT
jgi:hypothetical protein